MRRAVFVLLPLFLVACTDDLPSHVVLVPAAEEVDVAVEAPSPSQYVLIGRVTGLAAANDVDLAQDAAKNDLRNKAAAMGATLVTIDESTGEALPLQDKTRVKVVGRAYKSVD